MKRGMRREFRIVKKCQRGSGRAWESLLLLLLLLLVVVVVVLVLLLLGV